MPARGTRPHPGPETQQQKDIKTNFIKELIIQHIIGSFGLCAKQFLFSKGHHISYLCLKTHRKNMHAAMEPNVLSTRKAADSPSVVNGSGGRGRASFLPCADNLELNNSI